MTETPSGSLPEPDSSFLILLGAARQGSAQALGELAARFRPDLEEVARRQTRQRSTAEDGASDVVQEALMVACRRLPDFDGTRETGFRAWLRRIVTLTARNRTRRAQMRGAIALDHAPVPLDPADSPSSIAGSNEELERLDRALTHLTEQERIVLHWRINENLSFAEIGRRLGKSDKSASLAYEKCISNLKHILIPHAQHESQTPLKP
jgi:RNA polymerase sigma-70 factor (ECF subfamily)